MILSRPAKHLSLRRNNDILKCFDVISPSHPLVILQVNFLITDEAVYLLKKPLFVWSFIFQ